VGEILNGNGDQDEILPLPASLITHRNYFG